ncbi:MAG TPA: hypothetical protein VLY65_02905, partial [Nitrososphaerales archaeon]|nr:hypothetical protein [Nitrososphaerales archaeon]
MQSVPEHVCLRMGEVVGVREYIILNCPINTLIGMAQRLAAVESMLESDAGRRFLSGVRSEASRELYAYRMGAFLAFAKLTPDQFAKMPTDKAEDSVLRYVESLKTRV